VERSGAAQGLAEVLAVLGEEYLEGLLPDILAGCASRSAEAREGHLTLFKFLPLAIPDDFQVCCYPSWCRMVMRVCRANEGHIVVSAAQRSFTCRRAHQW